MDTGQYPGAVIDMDTGQYPRAVIGTNQMDTGPYYCISKLLEKHNNYAYIG